MRLTDDFKDEIRARIRLSDLIGRTVPLKRQGREFAGLSPFKKEKTPSFFVNDEKRFYHCFASGEHGDAFDWLMKMEGLNFMEAAERLAGEAGMSLPAPDPLAAQKAEERKSLIEWMEAAQRFFEGALRSRAGTNARRYLESRGLGPDDWKRFGIGYAPDGRAALKDELIQAGAHARDLIECGLLINPDDSTPAYDRFRDRVMFPIRDPRGRLVAFGGRALSKQARAKYLNSPETPIFHKGSTLYRYPEARRAASDPTSGARGLIVAEGYLDAIAFARAGIEYAVAPLGTALTEDQLTLLWRAGGEPVLCFDGDSAGRRAAANAADRALALIEPGRTLRFVFLPDGKDPDDMLREEGASALRAAVTQTRSLAQLLWDREAEAEPLDDPDRRAAFRRRIRALLQKIANPDVREEYRAEFDNRMQSLFGSQRRDRRKFQRAESLGSTAELKVRSKVPSKITAKRLIWSAIENPNLIADHIEFFAIADFKSLNPLRDAILDSIGDDRFESTKDIKILLNERGFGPEIRGIDREIGYLRGAKLAFGNTGGFDEATWISQLKDYMDKPSEMLLRDDVRDRLTEGIGQSDADGVRRLVEAYRRMNDSN